MKCVILDFETLDNKPTAAIVSMAAIVFDLNKPKSFDEILSQPENHFNVKFGQHSQLHTLGRTVGKSTLDWWKTQPPEVQSALRPSMMDFELLDGIRMFRKFCEDHGINKYSFAFCRGQSFDFPVLADIIHNHFKDWGYDYSMFPVPFWNQRDVRSYLDGLLMTIGVRHYAAPVGALAGFVKHNALHDCAKDIYLMQHYLAYANGTLQTPTDLVEI